MFPEMTTSRFLLRQIVATDQPKIFEGLSHADVIRYYGVSYKTMEETQVQMDFYDDLLIDGTGIWWAICYQENPHELIGACGFNEWNTFHKHTEIGYWLLTEYWGRGVMSECIPAIIQYAFGQMEVHRIVAVVEEGNAGSTRLLSKFGFEYEGTHKECEIKNGQFISLQYFALLNKADHHSLT